MKTSEITLEVVRKILKQNKQTIYNDHASGILTLLTGVESPKFTDIQIQIMCAMFRLIQQPYQNYRGDRINFLSYSFVLRKFVKMLNYDQRWLYVLPILKESSKLADHEDIWEKMCIELKWESKPFREI